MIPRLGYIYTIRFVFQTFVFVFELSNRVLPTIDLPEFDSRGMTGVRANAGGDRVWDRVRPYEKHDIILYSFIRK